VLDIIYGVDQQRIRQTKVINGITTIKTYVGGLLEKVIINGLNTYYYYISAPSGICAVYVKPASGNSYLRYIHTDHLGSINAVTDENGLKVAEYSFDAWGNRRDPLTWQDATGTLPDLFCDRGFTGHEHLIEFGLINMNGRVYDPFLGRMLSPDNYVQAPDFTQNLNRYSYCFNNPLKYTDPSGEWINLLYAGLSAGFTNWIAHGGEFNKDGLKYFGVGMLSGSLGYGIGAGVNAALAGDKFGLGFVGKAKFAATGFSSGFVTGFSGGGAAGFITGFGNAWIENKSFDEMIHSGVTFGLTSGLSVGIIGGLAGGRDAKQHDLNYWTGAGKQKGVIGIDQYGNGRFIEIEETYSENDPFKISQEYSTQIHNSTLGSDGLYHTTINVPKDVNGIIPFSIGNTSLVSYNINKNTITMTSVLPIENVYIYGWRYYSNPLNSFSDLFHSRPFYLNR
jgi:RHS repeat-associated protein